MGSFIHLVIASICPVTGLLKKIIKIRINEIAAINVNIILPLFIKNLGIRII